MVEVERFLSIGNNLGEGPLWSAAEQRLYWVDIYACHVHSIAPGEKACATHTLPQPVGCLGLRARGGFVVALKNGIHFWNPVTDALEWVNDPEADKPQSRFNDGKVDRAGRFWAGTMDDGDRSALYRLDPDGTIRVMQTGVTTSNGIGWSPDNRVMYYNDSGMGTMYAYDFDLDTGRIGNRRIFYQSDNGLPDGLTVDSEGCIWTAYWDGWRVERFDPDGKLMTSIELPVQRPTCPTFGGANLDELYITSAFAGLSAAARRRQPFAGDLFRIDAGVKGLPEPMFAG